MSGDHPPIRILQVMAGAEKGGAETAFVDMCIALHQAGAVQHVVTRPNALRVNRLRAAGLPVTLLPFGGAIDIFTPFMIKRLIMKFQPDIAQTWMSRAASKTPAWSGTGKRYLKICRLGGYYKMKYFRGADYFTTITPDLRRYLIDQGAPADTVFHINNFADVEEPKGVLNRADYQTPDHVPLLVTLGRLHQAKAFDTLLLAVARCPDVHLWIGGDGPDADKLRKLCHDLGLDARVRFLGWTEDRAALLRAGDICVFPSRYEPFGTVFVQAWSQGCPLITSLADGPRQYVRDGVDALTFDIDDVDGLVARINQLTGNTDLQKSLAEHGRARFMAEFTKDGTVNAYRSLYADLLRRNNV